MIGLRATISNCRSAGPGWTLACPARGLFLFDWGVVGWAPTSVGLNIVEARLRRGVGHPALEVWVKYRMHASACVLSDGAES